MFVGSALLYIVSLIFGFKTGQEVIAVIGVASFIALLATGIVEWIRN